MEPEALQLLPGWCSQGQLGEGAQARIFLVHRAGDALRRPFAAKVLRLSSPEGWPYSVSGQRRRLLREVAVLRSLAAVACPNVPPVIAHGFETARSAEPWYVMPFYAGGVMWRLIDGEARWAESYEGNVDRVLEIAEALAATLTVMHESEPRYVHRDVNASNVLFSEPGGPPILADFGITRRFPDRPAGEQDGEVSAPWRWRPPEISLPCVEATPAADVFMLGGLLVEALSGGRDLPACAYWPAAELPPYPERLLDRHRGDPRIVSVIKLAGRMLSADPGRRPRARAVARVCRAIRRDAAAVALPKKGC